MESTPDRLSDISDAGDSDGVQPLRDGDATAPADPAADAAQAEWDRTEALDNGASEDELDPSIAADRGAPWALDAEEEIPAADLPGSGQQPETQGEDPVVAELGEEGEGDLSPEDL